MHHNFVVVTVKKGLKSVYIYRSYYKNKLGGPFFWTTRYIGLYSANWLIPPNISESTGLIFTKFVKLTEEWVGMTNLTFVLWSPKGRCCGNQLIFGANSDNLLITASFFALALCNKLEHRNTNAKIFSPVTPEFTGLICLSVYLKWAKN